MNIPELVEGLAKIHGSVNAAARKCGMPEGTLHRLRISERNPRLDTMRLLARGYDVSLLELIRMLEDEPKKCCK